MSTVAVDNITDAAGTESPSFPTAPGNPPVYFCRAWVNFDGTGTVAIRESGNVSSITDNGIGNYTVNLTTAMLDTNYVFCATASSLSGGSPRVIGGPTSQNTTNTQSAIGLTVVRGSDNISQDVGHVRVAVFR